MIGQLSKSLASKILRAFKILGLRAKYHNKPLDLKKFLDKCSFKSNKSLDIGSGPNPKNPFFAEEVFGVDIRSWDINQNVKRCILGKEEIPFESNFFETVTAYDVLEHIPRVLNENNLIIFPFILAMNEVWRVLKVGGVFYSQTPCFPMQEAFQDPTHVNIMTEDTLKLYFAETGWSRIYGFVGSFSLVIEGWHGSHYFCILRKTSDVPILELNKPQISKYDS